MWKTALKKSTRFQQEKLYRGPICRLSTLDNNVQDKSDVVIIGGGVVGTSIAYHLAKYGAKNVVLLEKTELTAGSTWHAAGLVTYFNPGINLKKIHYHSLNLYKDLEKETGQSVGLHCPGSIRLCTTADRLDEAYYQQSRQNWHPGYQKIISPDEIHSLHPLLNMNGILGGIHTVEDGHIDPYSVTMALAKGARMHGAKLLQYTPALNVIPGKDDTWNIETKDGTINAKNVVSCTGVWGREIAQMLDIDLPLISIEHQYVITESIPEIQKLSEELPVIRDLENSYYLRQERTGMLIGPYESGSEMKLRKDWQQTGVPPSFGKELFEPDLSRIMPHLEAAMERVPILANTGIQNVTCGPICYAPDALPLVGPLPPMMKSNSKKSKLYKNFFIANGMSYGIAHAGGCGDYVSKWILDGEPPYDLTEIDVTRYGAWSDKEYVATKARESYGDNNIIVYPYLEKKQARRVRYNELYDLLENKGGQFGVHNGWEQVHYFAKEKNEFDYQPSFYRTNAFSAVKREVKALYEHVGITDLTAFSSYEVTGNDAALFLERLCSNTLPKPGKTRLCHLLTPKGKVMGELTVTGIAENQFYVVTGSTSELHDLRWLETHVTSELNVIIENTTNEIGVLGVAGPNSKQLLASAVDKNSNEIEELPFMNYIDIVIDNVPIRAIRLTFTGELGYELHLPINGMKKVYNKLWNVGQQHQVADVGTFAVNSFRLEKGFRVWGLEMNKDTNPIEAGLGPFVRNKKSVQYIGQESIRKIREERLSNPKSTRTLVGLTLNTTNIDASGNEAVWYQNKVIGNTTSGGYGHKVHQSIAYAYVPADIAIENKIVQVELLNTKYDAKITLKPFMDTEPVREKIKKIKSEQAVL